MDGNVQALIDSMGIDQRLGFQQQYNWFTDGMSDDEKKAFNKGLYVASQGFKNALDAGAGNVVSAYSCFLFGLILVADED